MRARLHLQRCPRRGRLGGGVRWRSCPRRAWPLLSGNGRACADHSRDQPLTSPCPPIAGRRAHAPARSSKSNPAQPFLPANLSLLLLQLAALEINLEATTLLQMARSVRQTKKQDDVWNRRGTPWRPRGSRVVTLCPLCHFAASASRHTSPRTESSGGLQELPVRQRHALGHGHKATLAWAMVSWPRAPATKVL